VISPAIRSGLKPPKNAAKFYSEKSNKKSAVIGPMQRKKFGSNGTLDFAIRWMPRIQWKWSKFKIQRFSFSPNGPQKMPEEDLSGKDGKDRKRPEIRKRGEFENCNVGTS
jgi:hypothetical protein